MRLRRASRSISATSRAARSAVGNADLHAEIASLREECDVLRAENTLLRGTLNTLHETCPVEWGLTKQQAQVAGLLLRANGRVVRNEQLDDLLDIDQTRDFGKGLRGTLVCKIRRKITPHGWRIRTVWGIGYVMDRAAVLAPFEGAEGLKEQTT